MKLSVLFIFVCAVQCCVEGADCFERLENVTFTPRTDDVGNETTVESEDACMDTCVQDYQCSIATYYLETKKCLTYKFNSEDGGPMKEENCTSACITRMVTVPKFCYAVSNLTDVISNDRLENCHAIGHLCKQNFKLQAEIVKTNSILQIVTKIALGKSVQDVLALGLIEASKNGRNEEVKVLLTLGANIDGMDKREYTSLMWACKEGHTAVVKLLVEHGAMVNLQNSYGLNGVLWASVSGYVDIVRYLIHKGADLNAEDKDGSTSFIMASYYGHVELAKLLMQHNVDVNGTDDDGKTALDYAIEREYTQLQEFLQQNGGKRGRDVK